jgi:hypothetical protein
VPNQDHPQLAEVLAYLNAKQECAVVHPPSNHEVAIEFDRTSEWYAQATLQEAPDATAQKKLKAAGLKTRSREMQMGFGASRGKAIQFFTAAGDFKSPEDAARAALSVFVVLWQLPVTEWLWVTAREYDDRDEPKRPGVWPPAAP